MSTGWKKRTGDAWAVRCWYWKPGADRDADVDPLDVQEQQFRRCPKSMVHAIGQKMAADPRATSPGMYDVMHGTPDDFSGDGYDWQVHEEVRP